MSKILILQILLYIFLINYSFQQTSSCLYFPAYIKPICESLKYNSTHGCQYIEGQCVLKPSCSSYTGNDANICKSIALLGPSKKCVMQNNICTEVLKPCEEYEQGKNLCESLDPGDSTTKRCLLYNGICKAHYKNCGDFITGVFFARF